MAARQASGNREIKTNAVRVSSKRRRLLQWPRARVRVSRRREGAHHRPHDTSACRVRTCSPTRLALSSVSPLKMNIFLRFRAVVRSLTMRVLSYLPSLYDHEAFSIPGDAVLASPPLGSKINLEYYTTYSCLLYTSPSPRDRQKSRMPSSA